VFENRVLRRIFGPKGDEVTREWSCTMRSFLICTHPKILLGRSNQWEWGGRDMWHAWEKKEKCTRFWWKIPMGDRGVNRRMGWEWIVGRLAWGLEWIQVSQDRYRWWAVVNTVMNLLALVPRS
jgi:hypothetical protein